MGEGSGVGEHRETPVLWRGCVVAQVRTNCVLTAQSPLEGKGGHLLCVPVSSIRTEIARSGLSADHGLRCHEVSFSGSPHWRVGWGSCPPRREAPLDCRHFSGEFILTLKSVKFFFTANLNTFQYLGYCIHRGRRVA